MEEWARKEQCSKDSNLCPVQVTEEIRFSPLAAASPGGWPG